MQIPAYNNVLWVFRELLESYPKPKLSAAATDVADNRELNAHVLKLGKFKVSKKFR